jgi:hypothetical protein
VLVPGVANGRQIGGPQHPKASQKNSFLGSHKSVEAGDGRLEQPGCLPVVEGDIERPGVTHGGNATDDGIRLKIEKHQSRTNLAFGSGRERELTNEDLPEHQRQES